MAPLRENLESMAGRVLEGRGFCPQCGVTSVDDDGCCPECGADASGAYLDELFTNIQAICARVSELERDAARLDYLDHINTEMNGRMGSNYGWGLDWNHNRIALEDHHFPALTVREAIDAARKG